jgi:hypothetical protein
VDTLNASHREDAVLCTDIASIRATHLPALANEIAMLMWPADSEEADRLGQEQRPRLFLVDGAADPPEHWDRLTDWIRLPADERDIEARLITLRRRLNDRANSQAGRGSALRQ